MWKNVEDSRVASGVTVSAFGILGFRYIWPVRRTPPTSPVSGSLWKVLVAA